MSNPNVTGEKVAFFLAGEISERFIIYAPIDEVVTRPVTCYQMFNEAYPTKPIYMMVTTGDNNFDEGQRMVQKQISVLQRADKKSKHIPELLLHGTIPALCYTEDGRIKEEPSPDITNRSICIFSHETHPIAEFRAFSEKGYLPPLIALVVGYGMIRALASLHRLGFVHRGVSPYTFGYKIPITIARLQHEIVIIDFCSVLPFPSEPRLHAPFTGTLRYSSLNSHRGKDLGPADDIVSVIFVIAELIYGKLPWRSICMSEAIAEAKLRFPSSLCFNHLPREIRFLYYDMMKKLNTSPLNYLQILKTFQEAIRRYSYQAKHLPHFMR
ncbi:unnamed protein product [Bursaphelenchus xylophilus]|uniref:(pine wood nematode) hypothetical protein n=1 Tax=Bursaphelenchus xylophilus TaxID=6326 RepID=A0A1I7SM62_BURXY|nr:unnamed protein product [Bursaphelenchus xylophilus]CAG9130010.1 unnamed protein product [Bursaphelenchus xylophilus]